MTGRAPLVDATDIIRMVGSVPFSRAQALVRRGAVVRTEWADDRLTATLESDEIVTCSIELEGRRPAANSCSCPIGFDCEHVAAALLVSNAQAVTTATAPPREPAAAEDWRSALRALALQPEPSAGTPLGLLFELRQETRASRGTWSAPTARPATTITPGARYRLALRPVSRSATGNWVRGSLNWSTVGYHLNRLGLSPEQSAWFGQFAAIHRSSRNASALQESDWLALDDVGSPLLWPLLREAVDLGIGFVSGKRETSVTLAETATVGLDARSGRGGVELSPSLTIDGVSVDRQADATSVGLIGDHGLYTAALDPPRFVLAPLDRRLQPELRELLTGARTILVPQDEAEEFLTEVYPRIHGSVAISSPDASVDLPEIVPPSLLLTVEVGSNDTLDLRWEWEQGPIREVAEGQGPTGTLRGIDAAAFAVDELPRIRARDDVRVEIVGELPPYRELLEPPTLTVTTVPTDNRDWFDLGVLVHVSGREVPFSHIFTALARNRSKVLLPDKSYLSLDQPVFDSLKRLLDEAAELGEWEPEPRISRHQAALWWEFEELADETVQATAWREAVAALRADGGTDAAPLPAGLRADLRPYQRDGFSWLATLWQHRLGGILADDMGLGKTLETIALLLHAVESGVDAPFVVVAPTSVVPNWGAELARFAPSLRVHTVSGSRDPIPADVDVVLTSYALFRLGASRYAARTWSGLVLDEAQFVKNPQSKAHQAAADLDVPFVLALTGTPMENSLWDLWSILRLTSRGLFASRSRFAEYYLKPIEAGSSARLDQLRSRIRPFLLRRTKALVAPELPDKQEQVLSVDLAPRHRALYDRFLQKERRKLLGLIEDLDRNRFIVFRSLTLLRMLALDASLIDPAYADIPSSKLEALLEQLVDVVAEGHRALVFSQFTSYLAIVSARLEAAGIPFEYLDGSTRDRARVIDAFRSGDAPVFLISLKAGGFGLTLTEADYVFLLDPWWNPAAENQAIDRAHRIGQTQPVFVYRLLAADTIEDKVMALRNEKARLFDAVMDEDAAFASALTADDIRALLT
jgi:superfamily II DNA or RNA helicase